MKGLRELAAMSAAALAILSGPGWADTRTWTGSVDDKWSRPGNWKDGVPPNGDDTALFEQGSNVTVDVDVTVGVIEVKPEYIRTIEVGPGVSLTVTVAWTQHGGSFKAADGPITVKGPFVLAGGDFTGGTGVMNVEGELKIEKDGAFDCGSMSLLEVAGPFTRVSGTFKVGGATVHACGEFKQDDGEFHGGQGVARLESHLTLAGGTLNAGTGTITFVGGNEQVADFASTQAFASIAVDKTGGALRGCFKTPLAMR